MEKETKKKTTKTSTQKKASTNKTAKKPVEAKKTTTTTKTVATKKGTTSKPVATKKTTSPSKSASKTTNTVTKKEVSTSSKKVTPVEKKQNEAKTPLSKEVTRNNTTLTMIVIVLILAIVLGGSYMLSEMNDKGNYSNPSHNNTTSTEEIPEEEQGDYNLIGLEEYFSLKAGSEYSIVYVARPTCGWCQQEGPFLRNVIYKYDAKVNYLNTDNLTKEEHQKFTNSLAEDDSYFEKGYGTPLILIVKDNKIVDKLPGYHEQEDIISFFQEYNLIGEAVK